MKNYPNLIIGNLGDVLNLLRFIVKERKNDVNDFDNLKNIFISGRKSGKIPTAATDIDSTDRIGDINYDSNYLYIVIDNAGTAEWRRVALGTW